MEAFEYYLMWFFRPSEHLGWLVQNPYINLRNYRTDSSALETSHQNKIKQMNKTKAVKKTEQKHQMNNQNQPEPL